MSGAYYIAGATQLEPGLYELPASAVLAEAPGMVTTDPLVTMAAGDPIRVSLRPVDGSPGIDFERRGVGRWYLQAIEGWDELARHKAGIDQLALDHGAAMPEELLRTSASGVLRVRYRSDEGDVAVQNARLVGLCAKHLELSVQDHDAITRTRRIVIEEVQVSNRHFPDGILTASIIWSAPDPRRYGPSEKVAAGATVTNIGTAPTSPVMTVTGPATSPVTITENQTGRVMRWAGSLGTGSVLTLDARRGVAMVDGRVTMGLRQMAWPVVPPGESRSYRVSSGTLGVEHRSAWW